jgi:DNA modification methylase
MQQMHLFKNHSLNNEYGTFKDSMRAPIHRWFQYPAGFSHKLVKAKVREYGLDGSVWILDPFVGCGTTVVSAMECGINSIGIEAHPFVYQVARVKTYWDYDFAELRQDTNVLFSALDKAEQKELSDFCFDGIPELVKKCYSGRNLKKLILIRDTIQRVPLNGRHKDFFNLALTATLRSSSKAGTGWPYIAPTKYHEKVVEKEALSEFKRHVCLMLKDLNLVVSSVNGTRQAEHKLILGDARKKHRAVGDGSIDLAITSPPYLNNYDYADRTRLELYFFGMAKTWGEITHNIRDKLITAATTQITRADYKPLNGEVEAISPEVFRELQHKVRQLQKVRLLKGGKKNYDIIVIGYFNDMLLVLKRVYEALKPEGAFILVLGDSAPYGVYIPTEVYLGEIGKGIGFKAYEIEVLRKRGDKWASNPQRHTVKLKESILTLIK